MTYEKLTLQLLRDLKAQGYTILVSKSQADSEDPSYVPEKIVDVWDYLIKLDIRGIRPFEEPVLLVIDDALENIKEEDLRGEVFIEEEII